MSESIIPFIYQAADRFADNMALIEGEKELTYRELNERSNRLARRLKELGVGKDSVVAVCLERDAGMMIALFAILKAGGAYLPLDPSYPPERLQLILDNSQAKLLLADNWKSNVSYKGAVASPSDPAINTYAGHNLPVEAGGGDLAYVIYTSGSTGVPKGVAIEHAGLLNRIAWMQRAYPVGPADVLFFKTVYTFDVSVWEIFWWSLYGASVVLLPSGKENDVRYIYRQVARHGVSVIHFVPSVFALFLEYVQIRKNAGELASLKYVFTSGEKLPASAVNLFNTLFAEEQAVLINLYGPTEASIDVTHYAFDQKNTTYESAPIGAAIDNIRLYVLNEEMSAVEEGGEGYLYIGGIGLARGYYNNPELTQQKFVMHPSLAGERIYNTGDVVTRSGEIVHFIGRKDFQVKLRGLRIELSDIEKHLKDMPGVLECVILLEESEGNQFLNAYYRAAEKLPEQMLRSGLQAKIPQYMMPNRFIHLEQFPLLANGKLDRKKLPELK